MIEKLVRDRVPETASISDSEVRCAKSDQEFLSLLRRKLSEEVEEFLESEEVEELADILEVVEALCGALGVTPNDLANIKASKKKRWGAFEHRFVLKV
jgi:predicted house-cleaning noncanonical NTP pyrophosphatase (MazG superfamily)